MESPLKLREQMSPLQQIDPIPTLPSSHSFASEIKTRILSWQIRHLLNKYTNRGDWFSSTVRNPRHFLPYQINTPTLDFSLFSLLLLQLDSGLLSSGGFDHIWLDFAWVFCFFSSDFIWVFFFWADFLSVLFLFFNRSQCSEMERENNGVRA